MSKKKSFLSPLNRRRIENWLEKNWDNYVVTLKPSMGECAEHLSNLFNCEVSVSNLKTCLKAIEKVNDWPRGGPRGPSQQKNIAVLALGLGNLHKAMGERIPPELQELLDEIKG